MAQDGQLVAAERLDWTNGRVQRLVAASQVKLDVAETERRRGIKLPHSLYYGLPCETSGFQSLHLSDKSQRLLLT